MNSKIKITTCNYYYPLLWEKRSTIQITTLQLTYPTVPVSWTGIVKLSSSSPRKTRRLVKSYWPDPFPSALVFSHMSKEIPHDQMVFCRFVRWVFFCWPFFLFLFSLWSQSNASRIKFSISTSRILSKRCSSSKIT